MNIECESDVNLASFRLESNFNDIIFECESDDNNMRINLDYKAKHGVHRNQSDF